MNYGLVIKNDLYNKEKKTISILKKKIDKKIHTQSFTENKFPKKNTVQGYYSCAENIIKLGFL